MNTSRLARPRGARPLTLATLGAQVQRECEHLAADKVQNVNQESNYQQIGQCRAQAQTHVQMLLDAIDAGDSYRARHYALYVKDNLDEIARLETKGIALEADDIQRATQRGHEAQHKITRLQEARRADKDWRPGDAR